MGADVAPRCSPLGVGVLCLMTIVAVGSAPLSAAADDICVVCKNPSGAYRCPSKGSKIDAVKAQLKCLADIAKTHQHESCSVSRQSGGECQVPSAAPAPSKAPIRPQSTTVPVAPSRTSRSAPMEPAGETAGASTAGTASGTAQPGKPDVAEAEPPATVEALAKETARSTKLNLQKATDSVSDAARKTGDAVGSAAKKSWRCVSTLFSDC